MANIVPTAISRWLILAAVILGLLAPCSAQTIVPTSISVTSGAVNQNLSGYDQWICAVPYYVVGAGTADAFAYSDSVNPPTTQVSASSQGDPTTPTGSNVTLCFPVKNNDYWKATAPSGFRGGWTWDMRAGAIADSGDVLGNCTLGAVYNNNQLFSWMIVAQLSGTSAGGLSNAYEDSFSPPTNPVWQQGVTQTGGWQSPYFIVPAGHYYKIAFSGSATVSHCHRYLLPVNFTRSANLSGSRTTGTVYQNGPTDSIWISALTAAAPVSSTGSTSLLIGAANPPTSNGSSFSDYGSVLEPASGFTGASYYYNVFRDSASVAVNQWWEYTPTTAAAGKPQLLSVSP